MGTHNGQKCIAAHLAPKAALEFNALRLSIAITKRKSDQSALPDRLDASRRKQRTVDRALCQCESKQEKAPNKQQNMATKDAANGSAWCWERSWSKGTQSQMSPKRPASCANSTAFLIELRRTSLCVVMPPVTTITGPHITTPQRIAAGRVCHTKDKSVASQRLRHSCLMRINKRDRERIYAAYRL